MKNLILIFLIGLFTFACSAPPDKVKQTDQTVEFVQAASFDQQVQVDFIYAADEAGTVSGAEAPINWVDENLWTALSGVLLLIYEFLALKMPTSKSISVLGNLYKLLTWFIPDKSKNGSQFSIRDKL